MGSPAHPTLLAPKFASKRDQEIGFLRILVIGNTLPQRVRQPQAAALRQPSRHRPRHPPHQQAQDQRPAEHLHSGVSDAGDSPGVKVSAAHSRDSPIPTPISR
jgi:hypothetical protein